MKKKKDYEALLKKALSSNYEGRQDDLCEAWNAVHIEPDKKTKQKNGIAYTPQEVVDFMIESVAVLAEREFGVELDDAQILDPFAGTGIFGARLADLGHSVDNLTCYEIDPETAEIANKNISVSAGKEYTGCEAKDTFADYEIKGEKQTVSNEKKAS